MKYEEFMEAVKKGMQEKLGEEVKVRLHRVMKNNSVVMDAISIYRAGSNIAPTIYLNDFYQDYLQKGELEEILNALEMVYRSSLKKLPFHAEAYMDFEQVKQRLACRLVNREKNKEILKNVPHRNFLDLAMVAYYYFEQEDIGSGTILVRENHLDLWNTDAEEILDIARDNTRRLLPEEFMSMGRLLEKYHVEGSKIQEESGMYVLTNAGGYFGAVYMMYDNILEKIGQELKDDFWVLPSSIHECMIVPQRCGMQKRELEEMVRDINRREVAAEDFLSDEVYFYTRIFHRLSL